MSPALSSMLSTSLEPPTVGADCALISVSGAGIPGTNGLYRRTGVGRWVSNTSAVLEFQSAEVATWLPAPPAAVWGLLYEHTHKYYQRFPADQHGAELAPGSAGWAVRESKKGGKPPAPALTCATVSESCTHARIHSSGVDGLDGLLLARGPPITREGVASYRRYIGRLAQGSEVALDLVSREDAKKWFNRDGAMWGLIYPDSPGHSGKHQFLVDDLQGGPPLRGWAPRSTKHHKGGSGAAALECACGAAHFALAGQGQCTATCLESPDSAECGSCRCTACRLCPPAPPSPPAPPPPPPPPMSPSPPPPPPRPGKQLLLSTGFEDGAGGVEVPLQEGGGGKMTHELPSTAAKRTGANGLRVTIGAPFDPPWKAKVALGSFWAVGGMQQLVVTYWAKAEAPTPPGAALPMPRVDVLDLDEGYEWLGYWEPCTLASDRWTLCRASVPLEASRRGHAVDVSIILGHTAGTTLIDDILVVQQLTPPPAPPLPPPPAPPLSKVILFEDFELMRKQMWPPPDTAVPGTFTDPKAVRAVVLPPADPKDAKAAAAGHLWADVPTAAAAHAGTGVGARLLVKQPYQPAWRARLQLGTHIVLLGDVRVSFWGRAMPAPGGGGSLPVSIDVLDMTTGGEWVGAAAKLQLDGSWKQHEARLLLGPERRAHHLSFAAVVGAAAGEYLFDDITITQAELPGPLATGTLRLGFEADDSPDAVAAGLAVVDLGGGTIAASLQHAKAARTGAAGARIEVSAQFTPAWHAKLRLGTFRAVDACLTVTLHARLESAVGTTAPPFFTIDVLDTSSESTRWLGFWQRFNLSASEWGTFEAVVPLPAASHGHVLEVAVVLGYAAATYLIDDVSVTQGPAPPPPPPPPEVLGSASIDFEEPTAAAAAARLELIGGGGRAEAELSSPLGGRDGGRGAVVRVLDRFSPAWGARLNLGWFEAQRELIVIKVAGKLGPSPPASPDPPMPPPPPPRTDDVWEVCAPRTEKDTKVEKCTPWCVDGKSSADARKERCHLCKCRACSHCAAPPEPFLTVDVLDRDNASRWLGFWQRFNLSASEWRTFEAVVPLPAASHGHVLEVVLVLGHSANTYLIDDVSIMQRDSPASARCFASNRRWSACCLLLERPLPAPRWGCVRLPTTTGAWRACACAGHPGAGQRTSPAPPHASRSQARSRSRSTLRSVTLQWWPWANQRAAATPPPPVKMAAAR